MLHVYVFVVLYCKALAENWFWFLLHLDLIQHLKGSYLATLHLQIRGGRKRTLAECLKNEFRLTMNLLRSVISSDVYEVHMF